MKITLNKSFYPIEAIKKAVEDFNDIFSGSIEEESEAYIITVNAKVQLDDKLGDEFSNYVLGLIKNNGLV